VQVHYDEGIANCIGSAGKVIRGGGRRFAATLSSPNFMRCPVPNMGAILDVTFRQIVPSP
jgi:hypothetical protein